jgi:hypothetical protein
MQLETRIDILVGLGEYLLSGDEYLEAVIHRTSFHNPWFTKENQHEAIQAIAETFLQREVLESWLERYGNPEPTSPKRVGLVMAGNIPLVGFHDWMSVFAAGHQAVIKLSDKDPYLFPALFRWLEKEYPEAASYWELVDRLEDFDAVIATGSNNSARYFESYFGHVPHIIRRNRNSVAVLEGTEGEEELSQLAEDVVQFFGLGCRNVSKLYVPQGYDFDNLLEALHAHRATLLNHDKYRNNFDYNFALFTLNLIPVKATGAVILREEATIASRIASLHYSFYENLEAVEKELEAHADELQAVVARDGLLQRPTVPFGQAQRPAINDYADGVDTMEFLTAL